MTDSIRYAGFWPRFAAKSLEILIFLPFFAFVWWGEGHFRLFSLYYFLPGILFGLFYEVYLVQRFGGTPGKLIMGLRIRKVDGSAVGYREAFLRYFPDFVLGMLISLAWVYALLHITDTEYYTLSLLERAKRLEELAPYWIKRLNITQQVWMWSELIVILTNRKRRALHDFIAGTVVIHKQTNH